MVGRRIYRGNWKPCSTAKTRAQARIPLRFPQPSYALRSRCEKVAGGNPVKIVNPLPRTARYPGRGRWNQLLRAPVRYTTVDVIAPSKLGKGGWDVRQHSETFRWDPAGGSPSSSV